MNNSLSARLFMRGGPQANDRLKAGKLWSFHKALENDYNSREIKLDKDGRTHRCLINTDNLKPDYDKKILSIDFDAGLESGDTFSCVDDDTHWLVYLPFLTETAYFRTVIIRCRYQVLVDDVPYWIYFQGPMETDVRWKQEKGLNYSAPNLSGTIFIKKDERTKNSFHRFTHIEVAGHQWEVEAMDSISVPGVMELEVQETYENKYADIPAVSKLPEGKGIQGDGAVSLGVPSTFVLPAEEWKDGFRWTIENLPQGLHADFRTTEGHPNIMVLVLTPENGNSDFGDGAMKLVCGKASLDIHLKKSANIDGPSIVYPFEHYDYSVPLLEGAPAKWTFSISNPKVARIVSSTDNACEVEILAQRSAKFTLQAESGAEGKTVLTKDIKVKTF